MPPALVKSLAKRAGVSKDRAERLWMKAKEAAEKQGRTKDFTYITGILKRMLGLGEAGEGATSPDLSLLLEVWTEEESEKILKEAMPSNVRASLLMRYLEIEKQLRASKDGKMSMDTLTRSLRQGIYTILNWLASENGQTERFNKSTGLI